MELPNYRREVTGYEKAKSYEAVSANAQKLAP